MNPAAMHGQRTPQIKNLQGLILRLQISQTNFRTHPPPQRTLQRKPALKLQDKFENSTPEYKAL